MVDGGCSVKDITKKVRGGDGKWEERQSIQSTILAILGR